MVTVRNIASLIAALAVYGGNVPAIAQAPAPAAVSVPQYGNNINLEQARHAIGAALAEARRINVPMAVAVVDTGGNLVAFEKMDNTQNASILVAQNKAVGTNKAKIATTPRHSSRPSGCRSMGAAFALCNASGGSSGAA